MASILDRFMQGGQDVVKKVRDTSEVSRLNAQIAEEEKSITEAYAQIGKRFYETYQAAGKDADDDSGESDADAAGGAERPALDEVYSGWFDYITAGRERITKLREEIRTIQNVLICPTCGAQCAFNVPFCSNCGTNLRAARENSLSQPHCPGCGAAVSPSALFCTSCGTKL